MASTLMIWVVLSWFAVSVVLCPAVYVCFALLTKGDGD